MTRFESVCTFASGLAVSASVNLLTGIERGNLSVLRIVAAAVLLLASGLLFWSAEEANSAARSRITQGYPLDDDRYMGRSRPRALAAGVLSVVALFMLVAEIVR